MPDTLHKDLCVFQIAHSNICRATINTIRCCISITMLLMVIILLTATYTRQQHKGNTLLHFYGNSIYVNMPQCYITYTLLIMFNLLAIIRSSF
jgi:hypothetical protein